MRILKAICALFLLPGLFILLVVNKLSKLFDIYIESIKNAWNGE